MSSVEVSNSVAMPVLKNNNTKDDTTSKGDQDADSLHSYHMWLKEKEKRLREEENEKKMKVEDEEDSNEEDNFRVDVVLERGPSPPESDNANTYEWSYEEQFKQLYEIDDDAERKTFLDEYFEFMKGRGTPVSRIPIMAKQILDLYQLYNLVVKHGGLVQVIRNKQWSKITKGLNLPTSITSAAFTLRTQYLKYLYPYECAIHNFSTPKELQAAIDSNRRDRFSTLYHTEPTMTSSRDERYPPYPLNGCDYPLTQPRHHMPHPPPQLDMRFGLKRSSDQLMSKAYEKYGMESPKVIVLQDGTPAMAESNRSGKISPLPSFHGTPRSPVHDNEMRALAEIEARRRSHHFPYGNSKEWENDARHMLAEEEARRRLLDESRTKSNPVVCKDKNCNGIDCHYARADAHRHRPSHDSNLGVCSCAYCKDFSARSTYSPTRRDMPRHHMDGASANNHGSMRFNSNNQSPHYGDLNGNSGSPQSHRSRSSENGESDMPMTTLKMKLPDIRKGGNSLQICLEVAGVTYEGVITAKNALKNGDTANTNGNGETADDDN